MKNKFIEQVAAQIKNKTARAQIEQELESHIFDKIDYYVEIGYSYEEAERRATEEMGNPDDTAVPLNGLHNKNQCKSPFDIISIIFIIALAVITVVLSPQYCYASSTYIIPHFITIDFISTAIFISYVALIILSHKRKNKLTALLVAISLLIQAALSLISSGQILSLIENIAPDLIYPLEIIQCIFQPMSYAFITICTSGVSEYIDSIFSYRYITDISATMCCISSFILFIFLFIWATAVFITVYKQERMTSSRKLGKAVNITAMVVLILLSINLLIMGISSVLAYSDINNLIADNQIERKEMIDYIINTDLSNDSKDIIESANESDFDFQIDNDQDYAYYSNNNCLWLYSWTDNIKTEHCTLLYSITTYNIGDDFAVLNQGLFFEREDFINIGYNTTLDEFLDMGFYDKAAMVEKSDEDITFIFLYSTDSTEYKDGIYSAIIQFNNEVLVLNDAIYDYFDDCDEYSSDYDEYYSDEYSSDYDEYYSDDYSSDYTENKSLKNFMDEIMDNNK